MEKGKLIIGTAQMGMDYGVNNDRGQPSEADSFAVLRAAYEAGIDTLDTAEAYGNAHALIGKFHGTHPTIRFKIITKLPGHTEPSEYELKVREYLQTLAVPCLEVLMFHSYQNFLDNIEEIPRLQAMQNSGKFRYLGVSIYTNQELAALLDLDFVNVIQLPFNLLDNKEQKDGLLERARQKNKTIHTRSAFLQGLFFSDLSSGNPVVQKLKEELGQISHLSEALGLSIEHLALSYCLHQPAIDQVLVGVDSLAQLQKNIDALTVPLSRETLQKIDRIRVKEIDLLNPAKWPLRRSS